MIFVYTSDLRTHNFLSVVYYLVNYFYMVGEKYNFSVDLFS